jgi:hypothetical protein
VACVCARGDRPDRDHLHVRRERLDESGHLAIVESVFDEQRDGMPAGGRGHTRIVHSVEPGRVSAILSSGPPAPWYDCDVKTLIVHGGEAPLPAPVRDVIVRGSTSVEERSVADVDVSTSLAGADRIVFWSAGDEPTRALAARCASAGTREGAEAIVFVTPDGAGHVRGLEDEQVFQWPRDQDRLVMAFMTGA